MSDFQPLQGKSLSLLLAQCEDPPSSPTLPVPSLCPFPHIGSQVSVFNSPKLSPATCAGKTKYLGTAPAAPLVWNQKALDLGRQECSLLC